MKNNLIEVTEDDVLRGEKDVEVKSRSAGARQVKCKALSWAASCKVMAANDPGEGMILALLNGLPKEQANDAFLSELTPESLNMVSGVILKLTNGMPALKKAGSHSESD